MTQALMGFYSARSSHSKYNTHAIEQKVIHQYLVKLVPVLIVYFTIHNVSLRPLTYFCKNILEYPIEIKRIQRIICKAGQKAEQKLTIYDRKMGEMTTAIEIDTTWKGKKMKFFAAIDHFTNYLFCLDPMKHEDIKAIRPRLQQLAITCCNLRVIISDMALNFLNLLPRVFHGIIHLFCHNHLLKAIDRQMPDERQDFLKKKKHLQKKRKPMKTVKKWLKKERKELYNKRSYEKKLRKKKRIQCQDLGIPVNQNGSIKNKKDGLPKALKKISIRISELQAKVNILGLQVQRQLCKQSKLTHKLKKIQNKYFQVWSKYGHLRQIRNQFKALLKITDLRLYRQMERKLKKRIQNSPNNVTGKIAEYLELTQIRNIFKLSPTERLELGSITTNRVEGFFSQMRMVLDELRNAPDTPYIRARLTLLRYWHNVVGPLSGPNAGLSPVSRLGLHSTSQNPIRAISINLENI